MKKAKFPNRTIDVITKAAQEIGVWDDGDMKHKEFCVIGGENIMGVATSEFQDFLTTSKKRIGDSNCSMTGKIHGIKFYLFIYKCVDDGIVIVSNTKKTIIKPIV